MTTENPDGGAAPSAPATPTTPPSTPATPTTPSAPATPSQPAVQPDAKPNFAVPDAYKDKQWAGKITNQDDLWKTLENAQTALGKKFATPDFSKATPQEIEEFKNQTRPADKKDYGLSEMLQGEAAESVEAYSDMLHKAGLSVPQAKEFAKAFIEHEVKQAEKLMDKGDFNNKLKESFGDTYERESGRIRQELQASLSPDDMKLIDAEMPNKHLAIIYRLVNKLHKAYGVQESGAANNQPGNMAGADIDAAKTQVRKEIAELMARPHTTQELQALNTKLYDLTKQSMKG